MSTPSRTSQQVDLDIQGMSCASCAARIEKKLNRVDGVHASVNYATEKAHIEAERSISVDELIGVVQRTGYDASEPTTGEPEGPDPVDRLRTKLIIAALLSLPVIATAMVPPLQFPAWQWVSLVLATPVVFWGGWQFHRAAVRNLRHGAASMDTLISMGSLAAYLWSLYALFFGHAGMIGMKHHFEFRLQRSDGGGNIYLEAACGIITFILAGRYFEARSKRQAGAAMRALLTLGARDVAVLRDGVETRIPVDRLAVGDEFVVRPGEKIATDGVVVSGASAVDNSLVTGESVPIEVGPGEAVIGATVNTNGRLVVRASRVGKDTQLARIAQLVEQAQTGKAEVQRLADRISGVFVPIVIVIAAVTLIGWLLAGAGAAFAFTAAVAVLIIACPCALGLATPTALMVGTGRGAQLGIVIRGPEVLESTRQVDTIVLDKTGTVTTGQMAVTGVHGDPDTLRLAAAAEAGSEHPIGRAIVDASPGHPAADDFTNLPGMGVEATVDGRRIRVGRTAPGSRAAAAGQTVIEVTSDGSLLGTIEVADTIKPTSADAVRHFRELGLTPVLLTGDARGTAENVAREVGIDQVIAEVMPADKVEEVVRLQREGKRVAMVGDGVNDAAALATADLGIAMGTGTDAAIEASDLTLVRGDLRLASDAIRLSRATLRTIKGNLFWAFGYNVAAIPVAALGYLTPMLAGAAMALSSVFVVSNSLRLRGFTTTSGA